MDFKEPYSSLVTSPKQFIQSANFPDPSRINLYDTTLRDGEQMPGVAFSPQQKYEIAKARSDIGVHMIEVGFPAVAESERKTVQLIVEGKRRGEIREDMELVAISRCNRGDVDATIRALDEINVSPDEVSIAMFTSGSDLHIKYKIGKLLLRLEGKDEAEQLDTPLSFFRQANIKLFQDVIRYARKQGIEIIQVVAEDCSRADPDYVVELFKAGIEAGGARPTLTDTVGCGIPQLIEHYSKKMVEAMPDVDLLTHFHNDYGLGTINTITAMAAGFNCAGVGANGLGERAGNAPLHEVVAALRWLYGIEIPGFKYDQLRKLGHVIEKYAGIPIAVNAPVIGAHVFSHESGIHTAGVLIDPRIYEGIPSEAVGAHTGYIFGKHSGSQIVQFALEKHAKMLADRGIKITDDLIFKVTDEVKRLREEQAESDHAEKIVEEIHRALGRLGITDGDVAQIAISIAEKEKTK